MEYNFSSLPDIDEVRLHFRQEHEKNQYISITGAAAQQVASLWRELPTGEASRSLLEPLVITFHFKDKGIIKSLISSLSNKALVETREGEEFILSFDGTSPQSKLLFELINSSRYL